MFNYLDQRPVKMLLHIEFPVRLKLVFLTNPNDWYLFRSEYAICEHIGSKTEERGFTFGCFYWERTMQTIKIKHDQSQRRIGYCCIIGVPKVKDVLKSSVWRLYRQDFREYIFGAPTYHKLATGIKRQH